MIIEKNERIFARDCVENVERCVVANTVVPSDVQMRIEWY